MTRNRARLISHHAECHCKIDLSLYISLKSRQESNPEGFMKCKELLFRGRERTSIILLFADTVHFRVETVT